MRKAICTLVESDVLIFEEETGGFSCAGCFFAPDAGEMLKHVSWHRDHGDYVPRRVDIILSAH